LSFFSCSQLLLGNRREDGRRPSVRRIHDDEHMFVGFTGEAAQADLVEPLTRFDPRLVTMAPGGDPAED
jgi:hypothetical protein